MLTTGLTAINGEQVLADRNLLEVLFSTLLSNGSMPLPWKGGSPSPAAGLLVIRPNRDRRQWMRHQS